jgi:hypothetical protein
MLSGGTSRVFSTNLLNCDVLLQKTTISILKTFYSEKFRKKIAFFFHFSIPDASLLRGLYVWFHHRVFWAGTDLA